MWRRRRAGFENPEARGDGGPGAGEAVQLWVTLG